MFLSVVIPIYNCEPFIHELTNRLKDSIKAITSEFEVIYVNDGSPMNDWHIIVGEAENDSKIKGLNLSRNFGQHYAISAGLNACVGEYVVVMDGDLQDKPEEIIKLYKKIAEGHDVVFGRREKRKDKFLKKLSSRLFYKLYNYFTDSNFDNSVANFSISRKKVINEFNNFKEKDRSFPLMIQWLGYDIQYTNVIHDSRNNGKSSYTFRKLIHFAGSSIISQSNKPLKISIFIGLSFSFLSFMFAIYIVYKKLFMDIPISGWASTIFSVFFIGGLVLANIGIVGIYLGRVFDESKGRPLFIIKERIGF